MAAWDAAPLVEETKPGKRNAWEAAPVIGEQAQPSSVLERIGTGIMDPIHGAAQLVTHMLPKGAVDFVDNLNNRAADAGFPVARVPAGGVDEMVKQREAQYEARRAAAGSEGVDWSRIAGNVLSPANLAVSRLIPAAAAGVNRAAPQIGNIGAQVAGNVAGGAAMGAMNPTTGDDFAADKGMQIAGGAAAGAVSPFITRAAARVVSPAGPEAEQVRKLAGEGVRMTPGQIMGGLVKRIEDASTSIPFLGDIVLAGQRKSIESFDRAALNRSLAPIGEKLPANRQAGHDAITYAAEKIGDAYDAVLSRAHGTLDPQFLREIGTVRAMGHAGLSPEKAAELSRIIDHEILGRFPQGGNASGETIKEIESELGNIVRSNMRSDSYDARKIGKAAQELQSSLRDMLERVNPQDAADLKAVNTAYANLLRSQVAGARTGAKEGVFTPAQFRSAIRELDPSKRKSAFAKGDALNQDLAEAGQAVLPSGIGDSGTTTRRYLTDIPMLAMGGIGGALASIPYSAPGMLTLSKLAELGGTPSANALANVIRQGSPLLTSPLVAGTQSR